MEKHTQSDETLWINYPESSSFYMMNKMAINFSCETLCVFVTPFSDSLPWALFSGEIFIFCVACGIHFNFVQIGSQDCVM